VDAKHGVTTAVRTTQSSDRAEDLEPVVDASNANTGGSHSEVSADSGFCSYEMLVRQRHKLNATYILRM
jgi:hypothetical protein